MKNLLSTHPSLHAVFLLALFLVLGTTISQQSVAANPSVPPAPAIQVDDKLERATSLSLDQLKGWLKIFSIRIIFWSTEDQKAVIKVINPATLNREQWSKIITESFANNVFVKKGNETIVYILPAGISSSRVLAVTSYAAPTTDPFVEFDSKGLVLVKLLTDLPEIVLLQRLDGEEKKSGIYYERFVNPPQVASAYHFRVEYVPQRQAMVPISEVSSAQQGLEGFSRVGGVLEFIQSQPKGTWMQMRGKSGYLYLTTDKVHAPLFAIQQSGDGQVSIAMRSTMPNGTPFSYSIVQNGNTFTATTNLVSNKGPISLLDFATLGGHP